MLFPQNLRTILAIARRTLKTALMPSAFLFAFLLFEVKVMLFFGFALLFAGVFSLCFIGFKL